jgi:hypothetical protein
MVRPVDLHRLVRIAEVVTIAVLAVFAFFTYHELRALRRLPVALPNYQFEVSGDSDQARAVRTRGTWIAESGPPEPLLTTTIECRKARMECVESAALVVFVGNKGLLEAQQTVLEVERWGDAEVVSKPSQGPCATRQLVFNLKDRRARARVSASEARGICKELPARTLELVTGYRMREAMQQSQ